MRHTVRFSILVLTLAALGGLAAVTEQPAEAWTPCPAACGTEVGLTYVGTCYNVLHECLGFIYRDNQGQECSVSAEG